MWSDFGRKSNMKKRAFLYVILITIVLPWWGCKGSGTVQARQSQRFIYVPVKTEKEVLESVRDMAYWLEKADGSKYEIREADVPPDNGIRLVDFNKVNLSTAQRVDMETNGQYVCHCEVRMNKRYFMLPDVRTDFSDRLRNIFL